MTTQQASQSAGNSAAAPANAGNVAATSGSAEAPSLDNLLKEFENSTAQPKAHDILQAVKPVLDYVNEERVVKEERQLEADISGAVKSCKTELKLADEYPDRVIRGVLRDLAATSPEFEKAWLGRQQSPGEWSDKLKTLAIPELKKIMEQATGGLSKNDVEAAMLSVRNVSHSPQNRQDQVTPNQMFRMSDRDWAAYMADSG